MTLRLNGSTSGYTEIDAPAVAGNNTLVFPGGNGTSGQVLSTNGSGALSWIDRTQTTLATSVASTSGTAIDFTSIPSWVKQIVVFFYNVSTNGTSPVMVQIGSGSFVTSGYSMHASATDGSAVGSSTNGSGFTTEPSPTSGSFVRFGTMTITTLGSNLWVATGMQGVSGSASGRVHYVGGAAPTLSGALDRVRVTTVNGTDSFDQGTLNIMYQG